MKQKSRMKKLMHYLIGTCMLTLIAACGSDDDDSGSGTTSQPQPEEQQEGQFTVTLAPVNTQINDTANGAGTFSNQGDEFNASLLVSGAPFATHHQHIHIGTRCPTLPNDDVNGDGYIDITEAISASGGALVPLDNDLTSQSAGGEYPQSANYTYNETASFQAMIQDLRLPDDNPSDEFVKLGPDAPLNLHGKVVMVLGIPITDELPDTVNGIGSLSPEEAIPVLCGVISTIGPGGTTGGTGGM